METLLRRICSAERRFLDGNDPFHARIRVIVLTILTILLGPLPALIEAVREFNAIVAYGWRSDAKGEI